MRVYHVEPVVELHEGIAQTLDHVGRVGHGVEIDVLALALERLPQEEGDVRRGEVGVHAVAEYLRDLGDVRDVAERDELAGGGLQKLLLRLDAAQVTVGVAAAEAHDAHRRLAVEELVARLDVDVQVLAGVLIVHVAGDVEVYAAEGVDRVDEHVEVDDRVAVHVEAEQVLDLLAQAVDAHAAGIHRTPIDGVDLAYVPADVHERVARDADEVHLVLHGVDLADDDGVGVAVAVVIADEQHRVHPVLPVGVESRAGVVGAGVGLHGLRRDLHWCFVRDVGRFFPQHIRAERADDDQRQHRKDRKKRAEEQL